MSDKLELYDLQNLDIMQSQQIFENQLQLNFDQQNQSLNEHMHLNLEAQKKALERFE